MPKIIPLRELKNPSTISKYINENNEPVFVTKNGKSDLVILSSNKYDEITKNNSSFSDIVKEPDIFEDYLNNRDSKKIYSIAEIKQTLAPIFKKHNVYKAILFGSYVKGTADTRSDIDLLVQTKLKGLEFYGLLGDVADALRFKVDLIEERQVKKGSPMAKEIKDTGVTIYG